MWCAQWFHFKRPRQWINSGGLGTMGFGLPSAIGAQVARIPIRRWFASRRRVAPDDSQELATAVIEQIPVKVFIMNNGYLGMVRQWQELFWDKRYSAVDMGREIPNWVKLAEALRRDGGPCDEKESLVDQMKEAIATPGRSSSTCT